jgi:hypothetical protein
VLPPIAIDLGPHVTRAELQYVLDACNEVVLERVCLPVSEVSLDEVRARASARRTARAVEIEVRFSDSEQPPLVRTLRFTPADPARERWRSVGLAIATLVGEGQRAKEEVQAARAAAAPESAETPAEPKAAEAKPAEAKPAEAKPAEAKPAEAKPAEPEPAARPAAPASGAARERPRATLGGARARPLNGWFIGIGAFGGPALDDGSARVGASLRGGWVSRGGLQLGGSTSYSWALREDTVEVSWLAIQAGIGHRFWLTDELSLGLSAQAGVQRLRFEASAGDVERASSVLNPLLTLGVDGWWLPWPGFGFWLALDGNTMGRKSELFVADTLTVSTLPVDVTGLLGIGLRVR